MADQQDDDALFDRLAKSLEAVRYDAELARTGGAAGITASVTRAETELHRIEGEVAELRRRVDAQERSAAAGGSAVAQSAAEMRSLRESVELLSRRVEAHEARLAVRERSRSWPVGRIAPVIVLVVVLLAGAAAWAGFGLRPTPRELADRFTTRIAELAGFQPPPRIEPASVSPVAAVPPGSAASTAPSLAPDSPPAAPAPAPTPTVAVPAPAAGPAPGAAPSAAATPAVVPPAAVTPSPVAAPSASGSETASVAPSSATPAPADNATPLTSQTIDAANQAPISPAKPVQQVLLRAIADSWVEIRQKGGRTLLRRTMRPGDTWPIPADPTLVLNSGNAGRLELVVDGVATRLVPAKTGTVHDLPLDPASVAADARAHP